jgi:hypothetical protein
MARRESELIISRATCGTNAEHYSYACSRTTVPPTKKRCGIELSLCWVSSLTPMATSAPTVDVEHGGRDSDQPQRPLLRRVHRHIPNAVWYGLGALGFAILVVLIQLALYMRRAEPRDARAILQRELTTNDLQPGEQVVRSVRVYRRSPADYFRATRGLLVLTDRRLVYLGAPPRDIAGAADAPPAFDQREFRIDTLVTLAPSFAVLGFTRALVVDTPDGALKLAVPSGAWPTAQLLRTAWDLRHRKLEQIGTWAARVRDARAELKRQLDEYMRQPVYHVVRPGDAMSSIASWYEVPVDSIARLNGIVNNRIRVGDRLLIRPGTAPRGSSG